MYEDGFDACAAIHNKFQKLSYLQFGEMVHTGWFFLLFRPKKLLSVRLHVNPLKKVLSVEVTKGLGHF